MTALWNLAELTRPKAEVQVAGPNVSYSATAVVGVLHHQGQLFTAYQPFSYLGELNANLSFKQDALKPP